MKNGTAADIRTGSRAKTSLSGRESWRSRTAWMRSRQTGSTAARFRSMKRARLLSRNPASHSTQQSSRSWLVGTSSWKGWPGKTTADMMLLKRRSASSVGDAPAAGFERSKGSNDSSGAWSSIALAKREAQVFYELTREVGRCLSLEETLGALEEGLKKLVPFDTIAVYLHEQATLTPARVSGVDHVMFSSLKIPVGEGLSGWVAENQKPIVNGNPAVESGYLGSTRAFSTLRSALAVPLAGSAGVLGVLALYSRGSDAYTDEQLRVVNAISFARLSGY